MTERETTPSALAQLAAMSRALQQPMPTMTRLAAGVQQAAAAFTPVAVAQCARLKRITASVRVEVTEPAKER
jgi:hypothetical protein